MNVDADVVRRQIEAILEGWGAAPASAAPTAALMVETDLLGIESHGVSMLMMYETMQAAGQLKLNAEPKIVRDAPCTALIDAGAGLGHAVSAMAMNLAVDKAAACGVGLVGVRNSHHFGAAGLYSRLAAARGMLGLVTSSTRMITMVPTGGAMPVLGTNPIAFAAPAGRHPPFSLDMATTTAAVNKVKVYDLKNKPLPEGWVVDGKGAPVTDAVEAMAILFHREEGGLTPLGGTPALASHKGYGLGMLVHILAGTLMGGSFSPIHQRTKQPADGDNIGHFFLAIDPKAFREEGDFEDDLDKAIDALRATPPADPARPVLVAGDPEEAMRAERLVAGIPIPAKLEEHLRAICRRAGVAFVLVDKGAAAAGA
jgi:LDH2 family malate/lactate/ureidoglycolate dehydrogenase